MTTQLAHYSITRESLDEFNLRVPNGQRSATITNLIKKYLKEKNVGKQSMTSQPKKTKIQSTKNGNSNE